MELYLISKTCPHDYTFNRLKYAHVNDKQNDVFFLKIELKILSVYNDIDKLVIIY